jgi:expansin (peptidoglycan-binding protein)
MKQQQLLAALVLFACNRPVPGCDSDVSNCIPIGECEAPITNSGEGTFYAADGTGNCSFDASPNDLMVAALNDIDYAASASCGACAQVNGPDGSVTVRIVDRCPECPKGDVDLSQEAFSLIAPIAAGRVPITWNFVPCEVTGNVVYHFKEGSNEFFGMVQLRNHRNPIATLEWLDANGVYQSTERADFNFFIEDQGMGPGPYTIRSTDVFGQIIEDTNIPFIEGGEVQGASQFPLCSTD